MTAETAKSALSIRPLAELQPPEHLQGHDGLNRAPIDNLQITALTDRDAVMSFLAEYDKSPATYRTYLKECERLMLWSWLECEKPLSALTRQDFEGYLNFLADPQPTATWCGPKAPRASERWRPFVGPLSESAVMTAVAAINSLMRYLVDAGYLTGNPLGLIRQRRHKLRSEPTASEVTKPWQPDEGATVERFLDDEMWQCVTKAIEQMPDESERQADEKERLRFVCAFLYMLAPRISELETMRMNSFREVRGQWWWFVVGKGHKKAKLPVPDDMMEALVRYRKHRKLSAAPSPKDDSPLLVSVKDGSPITGRRLNQILKELFSDAAELLPAASEHKREKLRKASAHWGRHTGITAKVNAGMETRYVQKDARHADARTTSLYVHEEEDRWHEEAQKQRLPWSAASG
ncbi:Tyrosine recombinase XerC (plasmid) [Variovorax sp. WDL1]|uniref:tyrosine-type recombinase/integrase n=2 Tax=Variovorax TaxID=34072 RepID=UPI00076C82AD|nr:site-specific integrase [Variovorax sp. WDL1]KWT98383.1 putative integrase/recombinase, XerD family [Variovorax sp. WDL1]PNG49956.1 Tyrosine recombinase XerC [Variovorax sp. B2]PNG50828.1 Tyrosine recombinase XerC [Variovorax sp. B4]VTV18055.1 Tyrosine recombinase XerC [Variovorax sp. WDL1]